MKKTITLFLALFLAGHFLFGQNITFKPGPVVGIDASIGHNDVCDKWETTPNPLGAEMIAYAWTYNAQSCGFGRIRSLVRFDELNTLPAGVNITYAELRLFGVPSSGNYGNSEFPGSPYAPNNDNDGWIRRITTGWTEAGVTWNTQPSITTVAQVATPNSTSRWNFDIAVDVTAQVVAMHVPPFTTNNNGFMLMLDNEAIYRGIIFASSDHPDSTLWPELYVEYTLPCNADFTICNSTASPGRYRFSVDSVRPGYIYKWYFGDGTTATGISASHTYTTGGNYEVCLEVYNPETGDKCRKCTRICVPDLCSVFFTSQQSHDPMTVYFTAMTDTIPVASYFWDFGDGTTSTTGSNTSHTYGKAGDYTICLNVIYENGCRARYCLVIHIGGHVVIGGDGDPVDLPGDLPPSDPGGAKTASAAQGIEATVNAGGIKVSPNPVNTNSIIVSINATANGIYRYHIFNTGGTPVITGKQHLEKGNQHIELDVQQLRAGKYWIEFSNSRQQVRTGFIRL